MEQAKDIVTGLRALLEEWKLLRRTLVQDTGEKSMTRWQKSARNSSWRGQLMRKSPLSESHNLEPQHPAEVQEAIYSAVAGVQVLATQKLS